jgi:hypothetical protein
LARHGFITDDVDVSHGGSSRERWWRAAHRSTEFGGADSEQDDEARDAVGAFLQAVAVVQAEQVQRAVEERELLPASWREVSTLADWELRLTPARARALLEALETLVDETEVESANTHDSVPMVIQVAMFPRPGSLPNDAVADAAVDARHR